jgi:hypothetical protein
MAFQKTEPEAPPSLTKQRLTICGMCPKKTGSRLLPDRCTVCHCILALKARIKSQHCPEGHW